MIDDSYNSNPIGAAAALKVLQAHEAGRRILVTPGMVELGPQEAEENRRLGELAAAVCDVCLLSGPLAEHIRAGLLDGGLDESRIIVAPRRPVAARRAHEAQPPRGCDPVRERPARRLRVMSFAR